MAVIDPLVSTRWLAERLEAPKVVVIDATWFMPDTGRDARAEFALGHIPGAVFFDIDAVSDRTSHLPHMLSEPQDFAMAARRLGVDSDSTIVVYDAHGLFSAPRVWWNFRVMGDEACVVLDGGLARWKAEGRPLEAGWRTPPHGDFKAHPRTDLVRDLAEVSAAVTHRSAQIVDARSAARFAGAAPEPRAGLRPGHIPGARNVPWDALIKDRNLASSEVLREAFAGAGVDLQAPIITTCGSGITACVLALALARLGRWDTAVYDGSWSEWGARSDTLIETGEGSPLPA